MPKITGAYIIFSIIVAMLVSGIAFSKLSGDKDLLMQKENIIASLNYDIDSMDSKIVVDEKIINWAYKNAGPKVPRIEVVRYLQEMSKYPNFLMLASVVQVESKFNMYAVSGKGAKGLGQITTAIWVEELVNSNIWKDVTSVYNYKYNIAATNYILEKYLEQYGSWKECLNRYVGGDQTYVLRVLSNYAELTLLIDKEKK